jgi:hypothetical protein
MPWSGAANMLEVNTIVRQPHHVEPGHDPHPQPPTDPGHRPDPPKRHPDKGPGERHPQGPLRRAERVSAHPR